MSASFQAEVLGPAALQALRHLILVVTHGALDFVCRVAVSTLARIEGTILERANRPA